VDVLSCDRRRRCIQPPCAKMSKVISIYAETETYLLPCLNAPRMRILTATQVRNVTHNAIQGPAEQNLVFLNSFQLLQFESTEAHGRLTLYMVMQMNNSVRRCVWFWRKKWPLFSKSSGSQVTAVYLVFITSGWPTRGKTSLGGTGRSRTRLPFVSGTRFVSCSAVRRVQEAQVRSDASPPVSLEPHRRAS
jgi:hypothetical protein